MDLAMWLIALNVVTILATASILGVVYFLAYKNPLDFGLGHACAILFLALAATGATEYARGMIRKPYTVGQYMFSNGVRKADVARLDLTGYTTTSPWNHGAMDLGEQMFRGQCMNCHTLDGYRSMRKLMHGRDRKSIGNMVTMLHDAPPTSPYRNFMPPVVGTSVEIDALIGYLDRMENPAIPQKLAAIKPSIRAIRSSGRTSAKSMPRGGLE